MNLKDFKELMSNLGKEIPDLEIRKEYLHNYFAKNNISIASGYKQVNYYLNEIEKAKNGENSIFKKGLETKEWFAVTTGGTNSIIFKLPPTVFEFYKELCKQPEINVMSNNNERIAALKQIETGNDDATNFHRYIFKTLTYIFENSLTNPIPEEEINEGRKRIDIVFDNVDKNGFFFKLNILHHIQCPKILIECKNYGSEISNREIDQLQGRFNNLRGRFGILVCRSIQNDKALIQKCKDVLHDNKSYIIVLDDNDIINLINFRTLSENNKIDDYLTKKIDKLIM